MSDIKHAYPLILNKVASPHYATATLRRPRLIEWLNNSAHCRATVLAADAGYGKTTLLWQWEREVEFPCYWYKLDRSDRDWTFHISYLIEAIAKRHPGFGTRAHSMLQQLGGPGSSRPGVAAYLLAEMHERLTEPCTFIIDDWHYVNAVTEVRGLWNQILRDAPPTCRFVFSSRAKPKLQFARLKTQNDYAELGTDALRFEPKETGELFREVYASPLEDAELMALDRRTEGWAASLQLFEVSLRQRHGGDDRRAFIESISATSDSDLFDFLAEEVLDQQPEDTQNLLLSTSVLQQITPELAERLAGVHDGRHELVELERRGLFTHRLDDTRYRYHNLFREFLERRLVHERSDAEVAGLHIHAASYFETAEAWPEAIHHYLRAGLQRQAARLLARYGEELVSIGRLGLVDEWLRQLPHDAVAHNAKLSLLHGEALGMRGEWHDAERALSRASAFFARRGDNRLRAVAYLKLSSILSSQGEVERAGEAAQAGLELVPAEDFVTNLRLRGNLALTRTWLSQSVDAVIRECDRVGTEAAARGLEHYAAIADHNAGMAMFRVGRVAEASERLQRAAEAWGGPPTTPFGDNEDLVEVLLAQGKAGIARRVSADAIRRTRPWPRPYALARYGHAHVSAYDGRFVDAIRELNEIIQDPVPLGGDYATIVGMLVECHFLAGTPSNEILAIAESIPRTMIDSRHHAEIAAAVAIHRHLARACNGGCIREAARFIPPEPYFAMIARTKLGALQLLHSRQNQSGAWQALADALKWDALRPLRWWIRRYAAAVGRSPRSEVIELVTAAAHADPEGWRATVVDLLRTTEGSEQRALLDVVVRHPDRFGPELLADVTGRDAADARRRLIVANAPRLFVRTFGGISVHRGSWNGPRIAVDKRRVRNLLGALAAQSGVAVTRDTLIELLWPDADAESGVNSLNQTVFQLRRVIDPSYRAGESPEYVLSSAEELRLNPVLVRVDVAEILQLPRRGETAHPSAGEAAERAAAFIRGEFAMDLRYEEWATQLQVGVHAQVRDRLGRYLDKSMHEVDASVRRSVASALLLLDPDDEDATVALADALFASGQKHSARTLIAEFMRRTTVEFGEDPSPGILEIGARVGVRGVKFNLTASEDFASSG